MNIKCNNEAARVVFGDRVTSATSSWIQANIRLWEMSTGKPVVRNYGPDYSNYALDCSGVILGSLKSTYAWCPGSVGTATLANKNNGAKAETEKDIGFDAFAEVLEDAS